MENSKLEKLLIQKTSTLKEVLQKMDKGGERILVVLDGNKLFGVITDGDIRRYILSNGKLEGRAGEICYRDPITTDKNYDLSDIKSTMISKKIEAIPVVEEGMVLNILFWEEIFGDEQKFENDQIKQNIPVVIMAGGKGTRLDPFTRILPKPLIPVGNKPIIEHIIERFKTYGLTNFYLSVNHKAITLKAYFEEQQPDYDVSFIEEEKPLGTAGSLRIIRSEIDGPMFVSNCDILIDTNYKEILNVHSQNENDITLVASVKHYNIPYGICELNGGGTLRGIQEKPEYDFLVNTGFYLLNAETLDLIPGDTFFHLTHLIEKVQDSGGKVGVYPVSEKSWVDVGEWDEYKKTLDLMSGNL